MIQTVLRSTLAGLAATAALVGSVAACSSSEDPAASASTGAVTSAETTAFDAYGQCLIEHGMPAPPAGFGPPPGHPDGPPPPPPGGTPPGGPPGDGQAPPPPPGVEQADWDDARAACESLAPASPPR
ncbi:hypothetical protein [Mycolicibacterium smegmatis]|uniref:hypothetical protein n=1 Tax=Mycolicibacterium smegmatis TaxID=1772 RepID=UPI001EFB6DBF|nr:hypothetical protein [Mycolicibacterium smegmatis]ULN34538.1 hypothetical protein KZ781_27920 [Mycolicibacterium smegmatis]